MISILKNLGIHEGMMMMASITNMRATTTSSASFIEDVYKNCKREGVVPSTIPAWVKDLFDFYGTSTNNKNKSPFSPNGDYDVIMMVLTMVETSMPNRSNSEVDWIMAHHPTLQHNIATPENRQNTRFQLQEEDGDDDGPNSFTPSKENHPDAKSKQTASPLLPSLSK